MPFAYPFVSSGLALIMLENVEHCAGKPEQAATMATHEKTKLHGEIMS